MHDGVPARFGRSLWDVLNNTYHPAWIGAGGLTAWPPSSPHFNPLNIYLWEHLESLVYATPAVNEKTLHRIVDVCQTISNYTGVFEWMRQSIMWSTQPYIEFNGGKFGHLLWTYYFSCRSQIKCFRIHAGMDSFTWLGISNSCPNLSIPFCYIMYRLILHSELNSY